MSYYFAKTLQIGFDQAVDAVTEKLAAEGFGILTIIDVQSTLKKKLDVDFPGYKILGACNPALAHQALRLENKIGTMLPCNVVVRETEDAGTEVAVVDPVSSMHAVRNPELASVAAAVQMKLSAVIDSL